MRKNTVCIVALIIAAAVLSGAALADFSDFSDVQDHWAKENLEMAYNDGILLGYDNGNMGPNDPIKAGEVMAIITRVLRTSPSENPEDIGISQNEWYYDSAVAAYEMGLFEKGLNLSGGMKRQDAFFALATAFQLIKAQPDMSVVSEFSDVSLISQRNLPSVVSLVEEGLVLGFDGKLLADNNLTRAEFIAMLYRIVEKVTYDTPTGSFVLDGGRLTGRTVDKMWIAGDVTNLHLSGITADLIVIRSENLTGSYLANVRTDRLAVATECEYNLETRGISRIDTLTVGAAGGKVTVSARPETVEIVSRNRETEIVGAADTVIVAGSGNTVTISSGQVYDVIVTGENNKVILNRGVDSLAIRGDNATVEGEGNIRTLIVGVENYTVTAPYTNLETEGLIGSQVEISVQDKLPAGTPLTATASVAGGEDKGGYIGYWTIDGVKGEEFEVDLSQQREFTVEYTYEYTYDMAKWGKVQFTLTDPGGKVKSVSSEKEFEIENYPLSHYYDGDILAAVTTGYKGDWTLSWAENHDYSELEKVLWVNTKGYESDTEYLIWVSLTYQRCNVFKNVGGTWQLERSSIVATGKPGTDTPVGVYKTTYKQSGWFTPSYNCFPVVRFYEGTGYAFHSRLYQPWSRTVLQDSRIGFPISLGCIRMYDEDIQWLYDNIPSDTTVVVY